MSDKKVCEVCARPLGLAPRSAESRTDGRCARLGSAECYRIGFEREKAKAAILTPEVLRLIEAGRALALAEQHWAEARAGARKAYRIAEEHLTGAALALPFEKPAESNHTERG